MRRKVNLYTDGACSGNPGAGGFGVILECDGHEKEHSQGFSQTTNNRMELLAVIEGLSMLKYPCEVQCFSDSKYVIDAIEKGWVYKWRKNNWRRSNKEPALNVDLWEQLLPLLERHRVRFTWVKGHAGHPQNERCDYLATTAITRV